jgi:hypothetical protein
MTRYYVRPPEQVACGISYCGPNAAGTNRLDTEFEHELFHANFSGYAALDGPITIHDHDRYYHHGDQITFPDGTHGVEPDRDHWEEHLDQGHPISGDYTTAYWRWRRNPSRGVNSLRQVWASIGLGPDGAPAKPAEPVQTDIFDFLDAP